MPTHSHNSHNFRKTEFSTRSSTFIRLYKASMLVHAQFFISILSIQSEQNASIASTQVSTKKFLRKLAATLSQVKLAAVCWLIVRLSPLAQSSEQGPLLKYFWLCNIQVTRLSSVSFYISQRNIALDFQVWPVLVHFSTNLTNLSMLHLKFALTMAFNILTYDEYDTFK